MVDQITEMYISIHAPQWGATCRTPCHACCLLISIHAPQWGATDGVRDAVNQALFQSTHPSGVRPGYLTGTDSLFQFQSTHPSGVRRDGAHFGIITTGIFQSTHPSGVRPHTLGEPRRGINFNPRTPVGCDRRRRSPFGWSRYFNPRTPVGCDRRRETRHRHHLDFNPRTPVGCDRRRGQADDGELISIHAPQWGATAGAGKLTTEN